ncbi:MAG: hypothetical protein P0Y55_03280 [Candidatus Cohnella colombiensis]|uniref:Uncharacterized protein n=1 Tax=Candidatus Cohnella colombiensis TaxID=3121368 RepID=A0AA95JCF3_9BACL|nr:MAG: hypothetical protein P0Y55_03280 [Cohnella sp.]
MMNGVKIPQGDDMVRVELTVKELMALAGVNFPNNHKIEVSAKKKLNSILEEHYEIDNARPFN